MDRNTVDDWMAEPENPMDLINLRAAVGAASGGSSVPERLAADLGYIALIDRRVLERECLAHGLSNYHISREVFTYSSLQHWRENKGSLRLPAAVLFNAGNADVNDHKLTQEISELVSAMTPAPVVVLAGSKDLAIVLHMIALGARGYVPNTVSIKVCIQALSLAIAGGQFVPASSFLGMSDLRNLAAPAKASPPLRFTSKQSAVAEALRCGKANKVIAAELLLCESTIKVHVRNIMKKVGATNRTEAAYKIGGLTIDHADRV
jgi:DNA-binding NarL/FixJ family response regulator